jgi:hypothetical protein
MRRVSIPRWSSVSSIQAATINPGALPASADDSFSATMGYRDGSLAHLLYLARPKSGLGRRIEIFCDGETYVVDDFKRLVKGDGSVLCQHDPDKGTSKN